MAEVDDDPVQMKKSQLNSSTKSRTNMFEMLREDSSCDSDKLEKDEKKELGVFEVFEASDSLNWITYSDKKQSSKKEATVAPVLKSEPNPHLLESSKIEGTLEVHQPTDLESPFLVEIQNDMKGDDLTKEDYDDIVNIIRQNIGEGALVNESDYISIQYMNDLVLVQAYIDQHLALQKAAESDS